MHQKTHKKTRVRREESTKDLREKQTSRLSHSGRALEHELVDGTGDYAKQKSNHEPVSSGFER